MFKCPKTHKDEAKALWAKHLEDSKTRHVAFAHSKVDHLCEAAIGGQRVQLTLDSGADQSVVAPRTLKRLKAARVYYEVNKLKVPHSLTFFEGKEMVIEEEALFDITAQT